MCIKCVTKNNEQCHCECGRPKKNFCAKCTHELSDLQAWSTMIMNPR